MTGFAFYCKIKLDLWLYARTRATVGRFVELASRREQYTADKFLSLFGELVKRDLRKKYRRSVLGYFWSLLNPLMMMAVMMVPMVPSEKPLCERKL